MEFIFNPNPAHPLAPGHYHCSACEAQPYAGGNPHFRGCTAPGGEQLAYLYTPAEVARWEEYVKTEGYVAELRLPVAGLATTLLQRAIADGTLDPQEVLEATLTYVRSCDSDPKIISAIEAKARAAMELPPE